MVTEGVTKIGFDLLFGGAKSLIETLKPDFDGTFALFLLGAQATGKTMFRKALKRLSVEAIRETTKSTTLETTKTEYPLNNGKEITLIIYDFGGDNVYRDERTQAVIQVAPTAILFFIDQRDTLKEMPKELRYKKDHLAIREWELKERQRLAQIDKSRIQEHRKHFDELCFMIQSNPMLKKYTRLIVPIVTKYDIWKNILLLDEFDAMFAEKVHQLGRLERQVAPFAAVSCVEQYGVDAVMNTVSEKSGKIHHLLNWKYRTYPEEA